MAGSSRKRWIVLASVATILVAAQFIFQWKVFRTLVPPAVLDMAQVKHETGSEVRSMVDRMHGKQVTPAGNEVAEYSGPRGSATIYVSSYDDPYLPRLQCQQMKDRILADQKVFRYRREQIVGNLRISVCSGLGQEHYFFAVDDVLFWLAVRHPSADSVLSDFILRSGY